MSVIQWEDESGNKEGPTGNFIITLMFGLLVFLIACRGQADPTPTTGPIVIRTEGLTPTPTPILPTPYPTYTPSPPQIVVVTATLPPSTPTPGPTPTPQPTPTPGPTPRPTSMPPGKQAARLLPWAQGCVLGPAWECRLNPRRQGSTLHAKALLLRSPARLVDPQEHSRCSSLLPPFVSR